MKNTYMLGDIRFNERGPATLFYRLDILRNANNIVS